MHRYEPTGGRSLLSVLPLWTPHALPVECGPQRGPQEGEAPARRDRAPSSTWTVAHGRPSPSNHSCRTNKTSYCRRPQIRGRCCRSPGAEDQGSNAFIQPTGNLEGGCGLHWVRFARRVQVAEDHGIAGEVFGFRQDDCQRRLHLRALAPSSCRSWVRRNGTLWNARNALADFSAALLAMEHGPRGFLSDPWLPPIATGPLRHAVALLAS